MTDRPIILSIDVGTSGIKVLAVEATGRVIARAHASHAFDAPQPGWAEQAPARWYEGTVNAMRSLLSESAVDADDVVAIAPAGQMHGLVALDSDREVVRPALLWNDQRSAAQCDRYTERLGRSFLLEHTGNLMLPGFTVPKLLWMRSNEPEAFAAIRHVLLPKDYVRFRLGSRLVSDVSDASGTGVFDCGGRCWSKDMLDALQLPQEWWPETVESVEVVDQLNEEAARATGLRAGIPLVAGAGDQAASGVGTGIIREGLVSATIGTSGVVFASSDRWRYPKDGSLHAFCHAVPDTWHLMGVMLSAGGSYEWFCRHLMPDVVERCAEDGRDPFEVITEEASGIEPGADGLVFLPYLTGERTPHVDPDARGSFVGLTPRHERSHLARAVIEGAIFGLGDCLKLVGAMGIDPDSVRLSGGAAASPLWQSICADVFGCPTVRTATSEGTAYGAAILGGTGVGLWSDVRTACAEVVTETGRTLPGEHAERYGALHRRFSALYPALKEWWRNPDPLP
ncbi:MAG: xylulokinase [Planctomycetota bacterium]|nr:xylulokinase [Planctomycetota bacterium]